jgi:hypothetical protein
MAMDIGDPPNSLEGSDHCSLREVSDGRRLGLTTCGGWSVLEVARASRFIVRPRVTSRVVIGTRRSDDDVHTLRTGKEIPGVV